MNCIKLLDQGLMARDFDRQVAELQVRIAVLNRYTALGIPITEPVAKSVRGKGKSAQTPICATEPVLSLIYTCKKHCFILINGMMAQIEAIT